MKIFFSFLLFSSCLWAQTGTQYVSTDGSDANNGLTWATAKLTIYAALEALPGGRSSPPTAGSGEIDFTDSVRANPYSGAGVWLMGSSDPNYYSPPIGWLHVNGPLTFRCSGGLHNTASSHATVCSVLGGSNTDADHPGLWLSGTSSALDFYNLGLNAGTALKIGIDSTGNRRNVGAANIFFDGLSAGSTVGPTVDIGNAVLWVYFHNFGINGPGGLNPSLWLTDQAAAVRIDPAEGGGFGLIHFEEGTLNSSGILVRGGVNGGRVDVDKTTLENGVSPLVWLASGGGITASLRAASLRAYHLEVADCWTGANPRYCVAVRNDTTPNHYVTLWDIQGGVVGAYTSLGGGQFVGSTLPVVSGSTGIFGNHIVGQQDYARRTFGPTAVDAVNLTNFTPSAWNEKYCVSCTLTMVSGPDGTRNAGQLSTTAGGVQGPVFYQSLNVPVVAGDIFLYGVWAQSANGNGFHGNTPLVFGLRSGGYGAGVTCAPALSGVSQLTAYGANGWAWYSGICIIATAPNSAGINLSGHLDSLHPTQFYAPILKKFNAGTISVNEAWERLAALTSYAPNCKIGSLCTVQGKTF